MGPQERSNPTARRRQNYLEFFKIFKIENFKSIQTELSILCTVESVDSSVSVCMKILKTSR